MMPSMTRTASAATRVRMAFCCCLRSRSALVIRFVLFFVVIGIYVDMVNGQELFVLHEVGFDEAVDFAVEDGIDVGCLVVGSVVLYASVVEDVATYLAAPFYFLFPRFNFGLFFFAFF